MREADIMHEAGGFWVGRTKADYTVYRTGSTHSVADSSYAKTPDGLSVAIARCNYLSMLADRASMRFQHPKVLIQVARRT